MALALAGPRIAAAAAEGRLPELCQVRRVMPSGYQASVGEPMSVDSTGRYLAQINGAFDAAW